MTSKAAYEIVKRYYAQGMDNNVILIGQPKMRTPEQITAQLEARYAELEREAKSPERMFPCKECRWVEKGAQMPRCFQPLIAGLKGEDCHNWSYDACWSGKRDSALCGPEKALWEPRLTRWQRFIEWLGKFWRV